MGLSGRAQSSLSVMLPLRYPHCEAIWQSSVADRAEPAVVSSALITGFGHDSLGATRYSNQLKAQFNIQISQIELSGSTNVRRWVHKIWRVSGTRPIK